MSDTFESWAIVELMGRRRLAGYVTSPEPLEQTDRLRIDIYPGDATTAALTQFVPFPVYCLTPTTEDVCRALAARQLRYQPPVARWELEAPPAVRVDPEDDDDEDDGDGWGLVTDG
jgi:hypothetical protein